MLTFRRFNTSLDMARRRHLLPSALGSAAQREAFSASMRAACVFSATVANARFLQGISEAVEAALQGGLGSDDGALRLTLRALLTELGYTPEEGGEGFAQAERGSLQDLSSKARLDLIIDTQRALVRGKVLELQGNDEVRLLLFPCWELVRLESRRSPRGILAGSLSWGERWVKAGGPEPIFAGNEEGRMVAPKGHPVWDRLGDSDLFDDALDVSHPPFAFRSGFGWRELHRSECRALGVELPTAEAKAAPVRAAMRPAEPSSKGLGETTMQAMKAKLARLRAQQPEVYGRAPAP